ncbi:NADP-dependent succinate-semialdehyde dehydrogenase [Okibacterium endophyticum]
MNYTSSTIDPLENTPLAGWEPQGLIDGTWGPADTGDVFDVINPATGDLLARVPDMGQSDIKRAIAAADTAFAPWAARSPVDRSVILRRWADLIRADAERLATLLVLEQGKPRAEARAELHYAASFFDWFAEEARRPHGDTIPSGIPGTRMSTIRQPIGVGACITPWNFPASMITRKAAPALAAGCTVIIKPAEQTPLIALALGRLAIEAGVPAGVVNVVTGDRSAAAIVGLELTTNEAVKKISFTGSTAVGSQLMAQAAPTVKNLALELGGNAPLIVFDDADLNLAVDATMKAKFRNAGQACIAANRILVQDGISEEFTRLLTERISALVVGNGLDQDTNVGPLINQAAVEKVDRHVTDAIAKGATLLVGGNRHKLGGHFYTPTLLVDTPGEADLCSEETFGPVAALRHFGTESEALELANATPYGLAAYLFTTDADRVVRVSEALETGLVAINVGEFTTPVAPFGGVKLSGIGREGGAEGLHDWQETKYICQGVSLTP